MRSGANGKAYAALACVCVFWGTTYLGIRMAIESFPPATMVATRFLLSGGVMTVFALARGARFPERRELWRTALLGVLILGVGNGSLAYAELLIPSGLASLFITISPFYLVGIEAAIPGGVGLHGPTLVGMAVGFLGAAMLVNPDFHSSGGLTALGGFLITQMGVISWSLGSILQKRSTMRASPVMTLGVQQLAAGLAFVPLALVLPAHPIVWTARGTAAVIYLATFGSIVGYSAYIYALNRLPVAIFSIYSYVNAVVAVTLGWMVYREPFGLKEATAMLIIFGGVAIVKWHTSRMSQVSQS